MRRPLVVPIVFGVLLLGMSVPYLLSQAVSQPDAKHDVSPALKDIPPALVAKGEHREHPVKQLPPLPLRKGPLPVDKTLQTRTPLTLKGMKVTTFQGIGQGKDNYAVSSDPPDTNGAVGATQYVEWVNTAFAVYDKRSGSLVYGPVPGNTLWSGFGGNCEKFNDGDPIVLYDKRADRWLMTQFAVSAKPYSQCIAISTTPDATGPYNRYEFQFANFNDYPKVGIWPDAYYMSFNMFNGDQFLGTKACALERANMLIGMAATMQCFDVANVGGLLPSDVDGVLQPPDQSPNYFLTFGPDQLSLWRFHVDWKTPSGSTFSGPTNMPVAAFEEPCGSCIPQEGTKETLDTLGDRLMYRLSYRRFPDHESLFVNHAVAAGSGVAIRWYELRDVGAMPKIEQQGTYAPNGDYRWIGSMATDKQGNMLVSYSISSIYMYPSIRYTGRNAHDPHGVLSAEQNLIVGKGSQTTPSRWGDYNSVSVDPSDDCTFWFAAEYLNTSGSYNWQTSITSVRFKDCK